MWSKRTPEEATKVLGKPDVTVTNQGDKTEQIPKVMELHAEIGKVLGAKSSAERHGHGWELAEARAIWEPT